MQLGLEKNHKSVVGRQSSEKSRQSSVVSRHEKQFYENQLPVLSGQLLADE
jgi:hypothetical protein